MANFIISPYAISFESIKNNLQNYILNKPENDVWKDFYISGAGETIIEIAAALGAFYAYHFIASRRESFLSTAQNYTSLIGLAQNLGYSVARGSNLQVKLKIIPNQTRTLSKWTVIGSYAEYDVVLIEDATLNEGIASEVSVIIGNSMVETLRIETNKLTQFTFSNDKVTDDYRLILNDKEVPVSSEIKDAINDKYIAISNVLGAVDVFYLQKGNYQYRSGDSLYLQFIERNNLEWANFANSNLNLDISSQILESELIKNKINKEANDSIKLKAPIYHETSMVIRARRDYSKYLLLANPEIIEANDKDIYPGLIAITYIKEDGTSLTAEEKIHWLDAIEESRPSGVAKAIILDSILINKKLNITLWKSANSNINLTIGDTIQQILNEYEQKFEINLDLKQIEHDIENIDGIKIARVELDDSKWNSDTFYNQFDTIVVENNSYYVNQFINTTGNEEPIWPSEIGETIIDNKIVWRKTDDYKGITVKTWQPSTVFNEYEYIKVGEDNSIFVCDGYANTTGIEEPNWNEPYVFDNYIVWQKIDGEGTFEKWEPNKIFVIGDIITTSSGNFRCSNYRGKSSLTEPDWSKIENGKLIDGDIEWCIMESGSSGIKLGWNEYLKLDKIITIAG